MNDVIGMTPFFANRGYDANTFSVPKKARNLTERASVKAEELCNVWKELRRDIKFLSARSAFFYNRHRAGAPMLKEGDKVYLLRKPISTRRPNEKLDFIKLCPYEII